MGSLDIASTPVVWSTNSSREHLQLSEVPTVVESTSSCPIVGVYIQSTSSCRGDLHQSEVSPLARSTSSCPKYLQLSRVIFVRQGASYINTKDFSLLWQLQSVAPSG